MAGNLTREPELRQTARGTPVASLDLAVNRRIGDREEVCYCEVVAWGRTAENCQRFLGKGANVMIEGYLRLDSYEDRQTGAKRSKLRVVAESVQFLNTPRQKEDSPSRTAVPARQTQVQPPPVSAPPVDTAPVDDEIPF